MVQHVGGASPVRSLRLVVWLHGSLVTLLPLRCLRIRRFGDRRFYEDWWNARSFGSYYRRWNTVVHEWLYHYLYLDMIRSVTSTASA